MRFRPLLPSDDDVFPCFSQTNITFETGPHDALAISTAFVTEAPDKRAPTMTPPSKSPRSPLAAMLLAFNTVLKPQPAYTYTTRGLPERDLHISRASHLHVAAPYFAYMLYGPCTVFPFFVHYLQLSGCACIGW